ncbi:hypothetical protein [Campylobacter molothri]|uniref:hypothetical protein n=1 Tax=Campylobacter molothri TaxID=1032242 RepID=UPI00301C9A5B|nr:hypothetical protein [Campylobacter sp. W0047]
MNNMLNVAFKASITSSSNKAKNPESVITKIEQNPWCLIDLERIFPCKYIKFYGLQILHNQEKVKLKIEISSDQKDWLILSEQNENIKEIYDTQKRPTRYIKISTYGRGSLNLTKIEAFVIDLVIAAREDALGSRMYAFVNGMVIAKKIGFDFGYVWKKINHDFQKNEDLAGMQLDGEELIFSKNFIEKYSYSGYLGTGGGLFHFKDRNIQSLKQKPYHNNWGYYAPLGYGFDDYEEKTYHRDFKDCFYMIDFSEPVQSILNLSNHISNQIGDFIALHLRGGDIIHGEASKQYQKACYFKVFPVELALEVIKEEIKQNSNIVLFGDDLYLLRELQKFSKNLINNSKINIYIVDDLIDRKQYSITQMSFFEISLMSKALKIYRAGSSLFSRFAHAIGEAQMINIFTHFSSKQRYDVLLNNVDVLNLSPKIRKSYAYFCLYLLSIELKFNIEVSINHIQQAIEHYKDNIIFYSLYLGNCYVLKKDLFQLEEIFKSVLTLNEELFFQNLFFLYAGLTNHSEIENLVALSKLCDTTKYPNISYVLSKIYFYRKNYKQALHYCNFAHSFISESFINFKNNLQFLVEMGERKQNIEQYKQAWNFTQVEKIFDEYAIKDNMFSEYIVFLFSIGKLKKALDKMKNYEGSFQCFGLSKFELMETIRIILEEKFEHLLSKTYKIKNDYIAAYMISNIIEQSDKMKYLNDVFSLLEKSILNSNDKILKAFCIKNLIDCFFPFNLFFQNNKIMILILNKLHEEFLNTVGGNCYYDILSKKLKKIFINNMHLRTKKKVAVCIFGAMRGDFIASLENLEQTIIKPLNADVFIFSWNKAYKWAGLGGNNCWIGKFFPDNVVNQCPSEIRTNQGLKSIIPEVFKSLSKEYFIDIKKSDFKGIYNLKKICLENPEKFEAKYKKTLNRSKMWYGIYRSYQLLCEYEKENNFKYDFIVATRPDRDHEGQLKIERLEVLNSNEILELQGFLGPAGEKFAGPRESMRLWMSIWEYAQLNKGMSFFSDFPVLKISPHQLLHHWLVVNGIKCYPLYDKDFKLKDFNDSLCIRGLKIPDIKQVLLKDLDRLKKDNVDLANSIEIFFKLLSSQKYIMPIGAVDIVKNHLSYKLGKAIVNCKGLDYLLLVFKLLKIGISHKKLAKNQDLITYYDYYESQKIKKYFSYRLGKIFINAHKNWYKGGYIKLIFNIIKLKKEFKSKGKK